MARPAPGADRAVAVLELLTSHPDERFTLSEVARRCGLNKATAHALLSALSAHGVLLRHPDEKRYSLGPRLVAIGEAARRGYRAVDFVHTVLRDLATATGLWARAWQVVGDQIVCVAQVGAPPDIPIGARVAQLPLAPPAGAVFMAWADGPSVEAWLARAAAVDSVSPALESLPAIRAAGHVVMAASDQWRALCGADPSADPRIGVATDPQVARALLAEVGRQGLLITRIDDSRIYEPSDVIAPVFGATGEVEITIWVTAPRGRRMPGADLRALVDRVVGAADGLTAAICGRRP